MKVARTVVKKADWTIEGMVVLKSDNLDIKTAALMAASMVPRRVETREACWVETMDIEFVARRADWTVEGMVVLKADCLDMMRAVVMVASMVPRRVETRGACWVEMTALYSGKQKVCWKAAATVALKAD